MATGVVSGFVLIAGVLAAIAIPQFISFRIKAADVTAYADLRDAAAAQEAFYADYKTYADSIDKLTGDTYANQSVRWSQIATPSLFGGRSSISK
jgi:Tfp pilus assembly protein PilE